MPGSAANPVVLDPFRTIVEVGWNSITHLAFYIEAGPNFQNDSFDDRPPIPGSRPTIPDADWGTTWSLITNNAGTLTQSIQYINSGGPYTPHLYRSASGWSEVGAGTVAIDGGMPPFSDSVTYGVLDHFNNPHFGAIFQDFWMMTPGGEGAGLTVPDQPSIAFDSDTAPRAYIDNNAVYTESPYWADRQTGVAIGFGAYSEAQETVIIDKTYPATGMIARQDGRAFRAVATALHIPGGPTAKRLWILLARSPSDD